jgi:hypothetical protein
MDLARPEAVVRKKRMKRTAHRVVGLTFVLLATVFVPRLNPNPSPNPSTERGTVWPGTVRRGPLIRQVRGAGTLVPEGARLKAKLRIPETQANDIEVGQTASVHTRKGIVVPGKVSHIDAATSGAVSVYIALTGELPRSARTDLRIDGIVELERLENVVYVGRPAFGQENSTVTLFKVVPGCDLTQTSCEAVRRQVRLGRSSVNTIEILEGLKPGDQVVLSDMSAWEGRDRVRVN